MTNLNLETIKKIGNVWQSQDGTKNRVYFSNLYVFIGVEFDRRKNCYKRNGEKLGASSLREMDQTMPHKLWFDLDTNEFFAQGGTAEGIANVVAGIRAAAGE